MKEGDEVLLRTGEGVHHVGMRIEDKISE